MTRDELKSKNKTDLLALATAAGLAATPAMAKDDIIELLLANAQMAAASAPAAPIPAPVATETPAAAAPAPDAGLAAEMAAMREQMAQLLAVNASQASELATAKATAARLETDKLVPETGEGLPKEGALRSLDGALAGSRKMRVTIMATENDKEDVKLGVNGHLVQIKRGVPVIIDAAYVEVLKNSTIDTEVQDADTGKRQQVQMQRYPFTAEPV
jgi:hypothetical protein